jgi:hypothetical protein
MSDAGIDPPKAPQPPAPPTPPYVSVYGTDDTRALVRRLVTHLKEKKTIDLSIFPSTHLKAIEAAILLELTNDELSKYGYSIRRILRFWMAAEAGLTQGDGGKAFTIDSKSPGKDAGSIDIPSLKRGSLPASVEARTKVKIVSGFARDEGEAYALSFKGPAAGASWLQFAWRQIIAVRPSAKGGDKKLQMRINHQGKAYLLTVDEKTPRWTTDRSSKVSAFYEGDTTVIRSGVELTMSDEPSPMASHVEHLFDLPDPPTRIRSKFRAAAYLVRNMDVLYRADIALDWDIERKAGKVIATLVDEKVKGRLTDKLDAEHRAALALQFPQFDYFPGDLIGPPVPADPFEPISLSDPRLATWPGGQGWQKRYEEAALIARANLIEDVIDEPKLAIAQGKDTRGLNYYAALSVQGQTGYIGSDGKYSNPDLPISRYDPLPKVAILLGPSAFEWTTTKDGVTTAHEREKRQDLARAASESRRAACSPSWALILKYCTAAFTSASAGASSRALQGVAEMSHILHICALFQVSGTLHTPPALMHQGSAIGGCRARSLCQPHRKRMFCACTRRSAWRLRLLEQPVQRRGPCQGRARTRADISS